MIARLFRSARKLGVSLPVLRSRLRQWLELQPPDHFLLIEPDEELRRILAAEIARAVTFPVESCGPEDCPKTPDGGIPVVLPNREATARQLLPSGIGAAHAADSLRAHFARRILACARGALVGVASRWPEFLKMARAVLSAAGFHPDSLVFRDAREANWQRGLKQTAAVVCDSLYRGRTSRWMPGDSLPLLSESSIEELRRYEDFIRQPIESL